MLGKPLALILLLVVIAGTLVVSVPTASAQSPVRFDSAVSTTCTGAGCTTTTWAHPASTGQTLLILGVSINNAAGTPSVLGVTYDEGFPPLKNFQRILSILPTQGPNDGELIEMWAVVPSPSGNNLGTITLMDQCAPGNPPCGAAYQVSAGSVLLSDVNLAYSQSSNLAQTFGLGTYTVSTVLFTDVCCGGTISATPASHGQNDLIVDVFASSNAGTVSGGISGSSIYSGSSQTVRWVQRSLASTPELVASSTAPQGSTMSWTLTGSGGAMDSRMGLIAASIQGTTLGGGGGLTLPAHPLPKAPVCAADDLTLIVGDMRPEAANTVLWVWDWGDGSSTTTSSKDAEHTYAAHGRYQVVVRTQDASGRSDAFGGAVDVSATGCALLNAAAVVGPYSLALLVLLAFVLFIQVITGKTNRFTRPLLAIVVGLIIIIGAFVYAGWPLELPGHIKFG